MSPHLRFEVGRESYALPLGAVAEVARALPLHAIPLVPRHVGGVVNLRGEPVPALDGGSLLRGEAVDEPQHLLVLEKEQRRVGIVVERVSGIESDLASAVPYDPEAAPPGPDFVAWVQSIPGRALGLIDPNALFARVTEILNEDSRPRDSSRQRGEAICDDAF
jgi:purine-binding chemotaxis protein CheW